MLKIAENTHKIKVNWFKNQLKSYMVKYHDYSDSGYIDTLLSAYAKEFVLLIERIFGYGTVFYLIFVGIKIAFHLNYSTGTAIEILPNIFTLGLVSIVIREILGWWRRRT